MNAHETLGLISGILYIALGLLQVIAAIIGTGSESILVFAPSLFVTGNVFNGFVLLVIGAVFIRGFLFKNKSQLDSRTFTDLGYLLSLTFAVIALLGVIAIGLDLSLTGEEDIVGGMLEYITPMLYLGILGLIGYLAWAKKLFKEVIFG